MLAECEVCFELLQLLLVEADERFRSEDAELPLRVHVGGGERPLGLEVALLEVPNFFLLSGGGFTFKSLERPESRKGSLTSGLEGSVCALGGRGCGSICCVWALALASLIFLMMVSIRTNLFSVSRATFVWVVI